jgi:hypothetical protein
LRSAAAVLLAVCLVGAGALAIVGATDERELAFTTNVRVVESVVLAGPGIEGCQLGLDSAAEFDVLEFVLGTGELPGPPVRVTVREAFTFRELASGRLAAGARDNRPARVSLDRAVREGEQFDVCVRNEGDNEIGFYGGPTGESPGHPVVANQAGRGDMRIVFLRSEPRSALAQVPDMFDRATRFRPDVVGEWTFWLLLAGVAGGIPALLALGLRATRRT